MKNKAYVFLGIVASLVICYVVFENYKTADYIRQLKDSNPEQRAQAFYALVKKNVDSKDFGEHCEKLYLENLSLKNSDLSYVKLNNSELTGIHLVESKLHNIDFHNSRLLGVNFKKSSLVNANFKEARLVDVTFLGANLRGADFTSAVIERAQLNQHASFIDCNLSGAVLKGNFSWINFTDANLNEATLERVHLSNSKFCGASLKGTNLKGASLHNVDFAEADLEGANLENTNFSFGQAIRCKNIKHIKGLSHELLLEIKEYAPELMDWWQNSK